MFPSSLRVISAGRRRAIVNNVNAKKKDVRGRLGEGTHETSGRGADYDNSLQRKLVRLSREGVFGGPRSRDIALRDPFFCSHYRPVPRTLSSQHEHGGATQPRVPDGDEVARCGREMHLEAAMEEAQDMMAMLMTQLEYMQTELDIKSEEVRVIESSRFGVVHV